MKPKVIAVVGPTCVGKSALAIGLAARLQGEVISCDSMQVYRGMDIGTAKVTQAQRQGIEHHLLDIVDPSTPFSCAEYAALAENTIQTLVQKGRVPIFCGGTGQYLDAVLNGTRFSEAGSDPDLRGALAEADGADLWRALNRVDPESASKIHINNHKRVARALEIYLSTGIPKSEWDRRSIKEEKPYNPLIIGLVCQDRALLRRRIDERVDEMIGAGLVDEVKGLALQEGTTAYSAIGYKEINAYLKGACTLQQAVEQIKTATRQYAKRQMTWFKARPEIRWIDTGANTSEEALEIALAYVIPFLSAESPDC